MVSAALKVNKETDKKWVEIATNRRPAQAPSSKEPSVSGTEVTELKNVKRVTGAKALGNGTFELVIQAPFVNTEW